MCCYFFNFKRKLRANVRFSAQGSIVEVRSLVFAPLSQKGEMQIDLEHVIFTAASHASNQSTVSTMYFHEPPETIVCSRGVQTPAVPLDLSPRAHESLTEAKPIPTEETVPTSVPKLWRIIKTPETPATTKRCFRFSTPQTPRVPIELKLLGVEVERALFQK